VPVGKFKMVFILVGKSFSTLKSEAEKAKNSWVDHTPLKDCPGNVVVQAIDDKICPRPADQWKIDEAARQCAKDWGVDYTRIVALTDFLDGAGGYTSTFYSDTVVVVSSDLIGINQMIVNHELGHSFGLCDEGYGLDKKDSCEQKYCACSEVNNYHCAPCEESCDYCCPNKPEQNSIMCQEDKCSAGCSKSENFAPTSYTQLEKELKKYCQ
jgi:hypothetical protein